MNIAREWAERQKERGQEETDRNTKKDRELQLSQNRRGLQLS